MKSFLVQPFGQRIHVTSDPKEFRRAHNRHAPEAERTTLGELSCCEGMASHFEVPGKDALFLLYLTPGCPDETVYHEALHLAHFVMHFSNAPINLESTETQAYLMTHIAEIARKKLA